MINDKNKTVFFLGAGFSCAAGAPAQSKLLEMVINYDGEDYNNPIDEYKNKLSAFMTDAFSLGINKIKAFNLEDFYTPIDKCILENSSFRGYSIEHIKEIRNILSTLIGIVIDYELSKPSHNQAYLDKFVAEILEHKRKLKTTDHVAIITTNWDILLDRRFYNGFLHTKYYGALDYGTMVVGMDKEQGLIPPLVASERGLFRIKLFKIHGSLNWLKCPSCNRLFVNPESKIGITEYKLNYKCRFCEKVYNLPDYSGIYLEPQIIYPTFIKDLSGTHFNQIWNNTASEISEASHIIFIGYSFPQADFEIRQLLARKTPDNCKITIVLNSDNKDVFDRYDNFFGKREIIKYKLGAVKYIEDEMVNLL